MKHRYYHYSSCPATNDKNAIMKEDGWGGYASNHIMGNGAKKGYILPNCVGLVHAEALYSLTYAVGLEKAKEFEAMLSTANAEEYIKRSRWKSGKTPKLGSIMVWEGKGSLAGHVVTVTKVYSDGSVDVDSSDYGKKGKPGTKFYTRHYKKPYSIGSSYTFLGFLYPPIEFAEKYVSDPNERNTKVDQIKVTASSLCVRTAASTKAHNQGCCTPGYYDVLDTADLPDYRWYKISDEDSGYWVASSYTDENWGVEFLKGNEPKYNYHIFDIPESKCEELETAIDSCGIIFCREEV